MPKQRINTQRAILWALALGKEISQYDLPEHIGKHYSTVLRRLKDLETMFLVKVDREERSRKRGKDKKIYTLILFGLIEVLKDREAFVAIEKISENWSELLPLILGKWRFFKAQGCEKIIAPRLLRAAKQEPSYFSLIHTPRERMSDKETLEFLRDLFGEREAEKHQKEMERAHESIINSLEGLVRHRITRNVLLGFELGTHSIEDQVKLLSVLKKDSELRAFVESEYESMEENLKSWKRNWEGLPEK